MMQIPELIFSITLLPGLSLRNLPTISNSKSAYEMLLNCFTVESFLWKEELVLLLLNNSKQVIGFHKLSLGGMTNTVADIRTVFFVALKSLATAIILAHNHPSGNVYPSEVDIQFTKKILAAGELLNIPLVDHIIVSNESYYSFRENNRLE